MLKYILIALSLAVNCWAIETESKIGFLSPYQEDGLDCPPDVKSVFDRVNEDIKISNISTITFRCVPLSKSCFTTSLSDVIEDGADALYIPENYVNLVFALVGNSVPIFASMSNIEARTERMISMESGALKPAIRLDPFLNKISKAIIAILRRSECTRSFSIIAYQSPDWIKLGDILEEEAATNKLQVENRATYSDHSLCCARRISCCDANIFNHVIDGSMITTRVYVFLGENGQLNHFLAILQMRKAANEQYIVISTDLEASLSAYSHDAGYFNLTRIDYFDTALKSLLMIVPSSEARAELIGSTDQWKRDVSAVRIYDSLMLYARASTSVNPRTPEGERGAAIIDAIISSRFYESVDGGTYWIDSRGESEGNFTALSFGTRTCGRLHRNGSSILEYIDARENNNCPDVEWCWRSNDLLLTSILVGCATLALGWTYWYLKWKKRIQRLDLKVREDLERCDRSFQSDDFRSEKSGDSLRSCRRSLLNVNRCKSSSKDHSGLVWKHQFKEKRLNNKSIVRIMLDQHENIRYALQLDVKLLTGQSRSSLSDILCRDDTKINSAIKASLIQDLNRGLEYLHPVIGYHGDLNTRNCIITPRWELQILVPEFRKTPHTQCNVSNIETLSCYDLLWRAPEFLRGPVKRQRYRVKRIGSARGDVYSFSIIVHEIVHQKGPYGMRESGLTLTEVIDRVVAPKKYGAEFRPSIKCSFGLEDRCPDYLRECLEKCWREQPADRPGVADISKLLEKLNDIRFRSTRDLLHTLKMVNECRERENTIRFLRQDNENKRLHLQKILPRHVVDSLVEKGCFDPETFDSVTLFFARICNFPEFTKSNTTKQGVMLLDKLSCGLEVIIERYPVLKVETINNTLFVASGITPDHGENNPAAVAQMAFDALEFVGRFGVPSMLETPLSLQIGIHLGPVAAGFVGLDATRYCLFGDAVNLASRLSTTGEPSRIHISCEFKLALEKVGEFNFVDRGLIPIKGKGNVRTYWLTELSPKNPVSNYEL